MENEYLEKPTIQKPKRNFWKILAILLVVFILMICSYFAYNAIIISTQSQAYERGIIDIAIQQTTTGDIVYAKLDANNQTVLNTISVEELCGGSSQ